MNVRVSWFLIKIIFVLASFSQARAQPAPCPVSVEVSEHRALAKVVVLSTCRRDPSQIVKLFYDGNMFLGHFDGDGRASVPFVLNRASGNDVLIITAEGDRVKRSIDAPDFADTYRVTIQWQIPVRLRLHVVEPGRRLGQLGDISDANPNGDGVAGLGEIDQADGQPEQDDGGDYETSEQSFVLPDRFCARKNIH